MTNRIIIKNKEFRLAYESMWEWYPPGLPRYIIDNFVDACNFLKHTRDHRDLLYYPWYDSKQKQWERRGYRGIRLNRQRRMLFRWDSTTDPISIYIDYVDNAHYK